MIRLETREGEWECPMQFELVLREKYDVPSLLKEINKMQLWLIANNGSDGGRDRRPKIKGVRRFMVNWLNKECPLKPPLAIEVQKSLHFQGPPPDRDKARGHLEAIKGMLKR